MSLKPPPVEKLPSVKRPGGSFRADSLWYVPAGMPEAQGISLWAASRQAGEATNSVAPTPVTRGSLAGDEATCVHELPSHVCCAAPWSPEEAKMVMCFSVASAKT